jgi:beta-lactamase class D
MDSAMKTLVLLLIILSTATAHAAQVTSVSFDKLFSGFDGCFLLYDTVKERLVLEYNPRNRCQQRIPANSTFKIPLAVMAFDQGVIDENTSFVWDGIKHADFPDWDKNQTPVTWQKYSVVWVSQQITPRIGLKNIEKYLADFAYGNQNFSGDPGKNNGLTHAWLSSSLNISAVEQLDFLKKMEHHKLPVKPVAIEKAKRLIHQGSLANGVDYFAKTGSGWHGRSKDGNTSGKLRDGWYVGMVEQGTAKYVFVTNITDRKPEPASQKYGGQIAKGIALSILNDYFR